MQPLTPEQKIKLRKRDERRRNQRRREHEYRRRMERLRHQMEEARKRRRRLMLLLLLAIQALQESIFATFRSSDIRGLDPTLEPEDWVPDPANDFAAKSGQDDHCDGFSREQWNRMLDQRGIRISRKAEISAAWEADTDRELFPERYQLWGGKPYLGQIMYDLTAPYWQKDALTALKLLSPPETHRYLHEACATDLRDLLMCRADSSDEIVRNLQVAAIRWDTRKEKEAEEARKEKELLRKNEGDQQTPEPR